MAGTKSLPVLMYHYISNYPNSIAVSPDLFAAHCKALAQAGWKGIGLEEAEQYFLHGETLPKKSCLITFDDGYLDNYVYAWPILQRYGHKGVVFAVASRMEQKKLLRPTLNDVWNNALPLEELPRVDAPFVSRPDGYDVREDLFFSWHEAREMERSGVMAVASHTLKHQGVFINDNYRGFFLPEKQGRTFHNPDPFLWGLPRFVMGPGMLERAFLPDPGLVERIGKLVPQKEREAFSFAQNPKKMQTLHDLLTAYSKSMGRMETDEEMRERIQKELLEGKRVLEDGIGHSVRSLCWPWGAYSTLARELAQECGFSLFFTTATGANPPQKALAIRRFKAKANNADWLLSRVKLYAKPLIAALYSSSQFRSPGGKKKYKSFVIRQKKLP